MPETDKERQLQAQINHMRREWTLLRLRLIMLCQDIETESEVCQLILHWINDCKISEE